MFVVIFFVIAIRKCSLEPGVMKKYLGYIILYVEADTLGWGEFPKRNTEKRAEDRCRACSDLKARLSWCTSEAAISRLAPHRGMQVHILAILFLLQFPVIASAKTTDDSPIPSLLLPM